MKTSIRRYDLDWLRVIVFALLIFYHVGMFFVPWGWHIKNNVIYDWLRWPMLFLNQWRLPILFVISGMGTYYALSKRNLKQFSWERITRLGIPLFVGMLLIVPPQIYIERLVNGQFIGSYWQFFMEKAMRGGPYPEGNISWHHLWFLPYLLIFSLILGPLFIKLKKTPSTMVNWLKRMLQKPFGIFLFTIPIFLLEAFMEPFFEITHALIDDWFNFCSSITFFFYGFLFISTGDVFWKSIERIKGKALIIGLVSFSLLLGRWIFVEEDELPHHLVEAMLKTINLWSWILVLFGYAAHWMNKPNKILAYANRAVYPFYILHQTITIVIAFFLIDLDWNFVSKASILVVGTFGLSWVVYHFLILKISFLHPLFGLKKADTSK